MRAVVRKCKIYKRDSLLTVRNLHVPSTKPVLIIADIGRALLFGSLPIITLLGVLRIEYLFLVAFLTGTLTFFFDAAYGAFLPAIVDRRLLIEGNSKLDGIGSYPPLVPLLETADPFLTLRVQVHNLVYF